MKVCFYPNKPIGHKINPIINKLGWQQTNPNDADFCFWWKYTWDYESLPDRLRNKKCINSKCFCTTKRYVDNRFFEFFGVKTLVDPETYKGKYVMKTNANGIHYGVIYNTPTKRQDGFVYQKLYETKKDGLFVDVRIPYIFGEVPFVFLKYKTRQFSVGTDEGIVKIEMKQFSELFGYKWRVKFKAFCGGYVDYAEVDVLNGNIIDVNNTPSAAMLSYMTEPQKVEYINKVSEIFKRNGFK